MCQNQVCANLKGKKKKVCRDGKAISSTFRMYILPLKFTDVSVD